MALKFNPHTGEWDEVPDAPSDPVARAGLYFKGYWAKGTPDTAQWLAYIGLALIFLFAAKISGVICVLLIIAAFIAKSRYWLAIAAYFIPLPIAFSLRYICYNKWTLICSAVLFLGFLL